MTVRTLFIFAVSAAGIGIWGWGPFNGRNGIPEVISVTHRATNNCTVGTVEVTASSLNVRALPVNGQVIGHLAKGSHVTVSRCAASWTNIDVNGWVHSAYLVPAQAADVSFSATTPALAATKPARPEAKCAPGTSEVKADLLNVRAHPVDGEVVGRLVAKTDVAVSDCKDEWARVTATGWASAKYLSSTPVEGTVAATGNWNPRAVPDTPNP